MLTHLNEAPRVSSRVVVLGASGFLGKHLVRLLEKSGVSCLGLGSRDLDLTAPDAGQKLTGILKPGDALVFASALTPDKGKDVATSMRNLAMGQAVSQAVENVALSHVVYISSDAVYADPGESLATDLISDSTPPSPTGLYGSMHLFRELMMKAAVSKHKTGLAILRPCAIYGGGDTHNSYGPNRFLNSARKERKITLFGEGEETRDHLHIEDAAQLVALVLGHRSQGVLNLATGRSYSFMETARAVSAVMGGGIEIECKPRSGPVNHRHFDVTATIKAFPGLRFKTLEEGLKT